MQERKDGEFLRRFATAAAIAAILYAVLRYGVLWFLPLLLGGLMAALLHPAAAALCNRLGCAYRPCAVVTAVLALGTLILLLWLLGGLLLSQGSTLLAKLPDFFNTSIVPLLDDAEQWWEKAAEFFRISSTRGSGDWSTSATNAVMGAITSISASVLSSAGGFVSVLPTVLLTLSFTVLSTFLFLMDYRRVTSFIVRVLPAATVRPLVESKRFLLGTVRKIIGAYLLIMLITFGEITLGLWLLRVPYFAVIGLIIALLDILPFIGSGMALIPWGVLELLVWKNTALGAGLLILYAIVAAVRFWIEPRIVGGRIGLHPLATLTAMYAGLRICGFLGFVLAPLMVTLVVHLYQMGLIGRKKG